MVRKSAIHFLIAFLAATVAACDDEVGDVMTSTGMLDVEISIDPSVEGNADLVPPGISEFSLTLTDTEDGKNHSWPLSEYPNTEPLRPGKYKVEVASGTPETEGFSAPYFYGTADANVIGGGRAVAAVRCQLVSTVITAVYEESFLNYFSAAEAVFHSTGGAYIPYPTSEDRKLFLRPGTIEISLNLTLHNGQSISIQPTEINDAKSRHHYTVRFRMEGDVLVVDLDDALGQEDTKLELTEELINAPAPTIEVEGFTSGENITIPEGEAAANQLIMRVKSAVKLTSLVLTTVSPELEVRGFPRETDLIKLDQNQIQNLRLLGLKISDDRTVIDFTDVTSHLTFNEAVTPGTTFTLRAKNISTKVSEPTSLQIITEPVDLSVVSFSPAIIGINKATITVSAPSANIGNNIRLEVYSSDTDRWTPLRLTALPSDESGHFRFEFSVPDGTEPLQTRVYYCGNLKETFTLQREQPEYSLEVDPFATRAVIRVTTNDDEIRKIVTQYLILYVNGNRASIYSRDEENGLLTIIGLTSNTRYDLSATLIANPTESDIKAAIPFTTENQANIPNPGFEDTKETIKFKNLLSGGPYSQSIVEIFNCQNHTNYKYKTPVKWANTNAKTCSEQAENQNTWYMQPSVITVADGDDGGLAVELRSVAYDLHGPTIPGYLQRGEPFTNYSLNIPQIANRAAGRLFLGQYQFNPVTMEESFVEGTAIGSRPSAINGFYRYTPSARQTSDRGLARVEVCGVFDSKEVTIASGTLAFRVATGFTAFSIPLEYKMFGVKASKIKIMFSSSESIGTIEEESASIITVADPVTASSTGSRLWIDNLSLTY